MNKRCFRVIFNRARGLLMAVAETVAARQSAGACDAAGGPAAPVCVLAVRPLAFGLWLALGAVMPVMAQTQVVADPSTPGNRQPVVGAAGNGVPVVNIQTPSAAGVSRNAYSQFDVDKQGVVLNNAQGPVQTQQAGWIAANPMLTAGTARVILNEVNSSNPSLLRGYVEVGGNRAQVVIANPSGIQCDGCGFINANRATLTTGSAVLDGSGNLTGYQVRGGTITIGAGGMDASTTDYTDVLARAVQVQGSLKASVLNTVAGANDMSADLSSIHRVTPAAGTAPAYGIDVAALGGMYAGKIMLTANELGVGVRNAGVLGASAGDAVVTTSGQLMNSNQIQASAGNVTLSADQGVSNSGTVKASAGLSVASSVAVNNQAGATLSGQTVNVTASDLSNQGTVVAQGNQQLTLTGTLNNAAGATLSAGAQTINAASAVNQGTISATNALQLTLSGALTNASGGVMSATTQTVNAASMSNQGSVNTVGTSQWMLSSALTNASTGVMSAANQTVNAASVTNLGAISATGSLQLTLAGQLDNQAGASLVATNTQLTSGSLTNRGTIDGATTLIQTGNFDLLGTGLVMGDHLSIGASTFTIGNENGTAAVAAARSRLDLGVQHLSVSEHALLHSEGDMAIGGQLDSNGQATGKANSLTLSSARIEAMGGLTVNTASLSLANAHFASALQADPRYPQSITEYQGSGSATRYAPGTPGVYIYNDESDHLQTPEGSFESWLSYNYTRTVQTEVVTQTDPAAISVGNNFTLNADTVLNDKSTVTVGGQLLGTIGSLTNTSSQGQQIIHDAGSVTSFWRQHNKGRDSTGSSTSSYDPADQVLNITLQPAEWQQNTQSTAQYRTASLTLASTPTGPATLHVDSSLFKPATDPQSHYLVETDPRFASYKTWLSTDYMLQQLSNPPVMQKRLGDGYYEQRLVREQVAQLTGRRFLDGYSNDEAQFQALMNSGVAEARTLNLQPGVALTAAQVAQLTSNIVWLVNQQVTLPDGTVTQALVPKVYAKPDSVTVNGAGTLIAASDLKLDVAQQLTNGGTLAGWQTVAADAQNLTLNGGQVYGGQVALTAQNDLTVQGGSIAGHSGVSLQAGHDLTLQSTTASTQSAQGSQTNIANVASVSVDGANAALSLAAGNDLNALAAQIGNSGQGGSTQLVAGRDVNLGTVTTASDQTVRWNGDNWRHDTRSQDVGSTLQTSGNVTLTAGRDANLTAASVTSDQGDMTVAASRDVNVNAGHATSLVDEAHKHAGKSGYLATNTITTRDTVRQDQAVGSTLSADTLTLNAGQNLTVTGSNVVSTQQTTLMAGQDVTINNAVNHIDEVHQKQERTSGLFSGGGLMVTIGVQQQDLDQHGVGDTAAASTVGSTNGNVSINAGQHYQQIGSQVETPSGSIDITAKKVDITEARDTRQDDTDQRFKQSGVSVGITSPILSAIQTAQQMKSAASQTGDTRMKALAAGTAALAGKNAYDAQRQALANAEANGGDPVKASGINISISLGTSQSQSHTTQTSDHAATSTVTAGGNVNIAATGDGANSDLTIRASDVNAKGNIDLSADHAVNLLAAQDTNAQHSTNKNFGASVGISFGSNGLMFNASVNGGRGHADGTDVTWVNSHVAAGNQLTLTSGGDTTLKGAVASGKQVTANVGGNLNIESLQDTSQYDSKQQSYGASISVGYGAMSGSANVSNEKMHSDYASVTEQSGIQAGDNGFQVAVNGNTDLKGAVISSTDLAAVAGRNRLTTGSLTYSDVQNHASYDGDSFSIGGGYSTGSGNVGKDQQGRAATGGAAVAQSDLPKDGGLSATLPIAMSASGDASSTTRSGISVATIQITDDTAQQAKTGQTGKEAVAALNRDVATGRDTSNALKQIFNQQELQADFNIVGAFAREAGTFLDNRAKEVDTKRAQADQAEKTALDLTQNLTDAQRQALLDQASRLRDDAAQINTNWGAGGTYRQIATALVAGVSGNVAGSGSEFARNMVVNYVQQQGAGYIGKLVEQGELTEGSPMHAALHAIVACAGAAASSQSCSSGALGAAASSVLTGLFSETSPDETQSQREAKRNLVASLVTGIATMSGENTATATNAASAAVDNNWLATQQIVQMNKELAAAKGSLIDQAKVIAKWGVISGKQDLITGNALILGVTSGMLKDAKGLVNLLSDLPGNLSKMQALLNAPDVAGKLSDAVRADLNQRFASINHALQVGGDNNAYQLGLDLGELAWQVGSVLVGVEAAAKASVSLARLGVTVSTTTLKAMAATDLAVGIRAQVAVAGRTAIETGKDLAAGTAEALKNTVKHPAKAGSIVDNAGGAGAANSGVVAQYGPLNPGPLSADFANTFRSGTYSEVVTQQSTTLYRVYGGTAGQLGGYWTTTPPAGPVQSIIDSALDPVWGNTATKVVTIEVPAGTKFYQGVAAPQGGLVGGGSQVLFPPGFKVDPAWIKTQ